MKCKIVCILLLICSFIYNVKGQNLKRTEIQSTPTTLQAQLMNEQISQLMADRVNNHNKGIAVREVASIDILLLEEELLRYESLMFPADELYGFWDTLRVNPYGNRQVAYPDTFNVDCSTFVLPIDHSIKVTSAYGVRGRRMHNGIDLKLQTGDTVRSAFSGKIRIKGYERRGYGYYLVVRHQNGLETVYGHLSKFLVEDNEIVRAGQAIALGGNTGRSTGSHLHFETRFLGQALNPSHIIDFNNGGVPHNDQYVLYKGNYGKNTNLYTSTSEKIIYHRVQKGESLGRIAQIYRTSVAELCRLNGLTTKSILRVGQTLRCGTTIDTSAKKDATVVTPPQESGPVAAAYHKVQAKETLSLIAAQYKTTVDDLCRLNNIQSSTPLRVGQQLCYRAASPPPASSSLVVDSQNETEISTGDSAVLAATSIPDAENNATEQIKLLADNTENSQNAVIDQNTENATYHIVKQSETLYSISLQYKITVAEICRLNGISEKDVLHIGQKIRYNGSASSTVTATPTKAVQQEVTQPVYYRIKEGDTLGTIAMRHGISINKLCELNNITRTTILRIGRSLRCS